MRLSQVAQKTLHTVKIKRILVVAQAFDCFVISITKQKRQCRFIGRNRSVSLSGSYHGYFPKIWGANYATLYVSLIPKSDYNQWPYKNQPKLPGINYLN